MKEVGMATFEGGKVVLKGTKNTAVVLVKVGSKVVTEVIHHSAGTARFVLRIAGKILTAGRL